MIDTNEVLKAVADEIKYGEEKYFLHVHTVGEYILLIEAYLNQAKNNLIGKDGSNLDALDSIRKIAALACVAMKDCGISYRVE